MELNEVGFDTNLTVIDQFFDSNVTLVQMTKDFGVNLSNLTNQSVASEIKLFDLYEAYRTREKEQLVVYKFVAYIVGTLIILSNITVVISSGLILKKGQQPKSTYLLLGNVSLADTIVGVSIVFGAIVDNSSNSNPLCIFQIGTLVCPAMVSIFSVGFIAVDRYILVYILHGLYYQRWFNTTKVRTNRNYLVFALQCFNCTLVCPAMVSIFSVGFIAVDRYIYILHGLYYQRWFNTTKVRIGILCIWIISLALAFLPATGYVNPDTMSHYKCTYIGLFPEYLLLLNALLSIIPICIVTVLYFIILSNALKQVKNIKASDKTMKSSDTLQFDLNESKLRIFRGNANPRKFSYDYSVKDNTHPGNKEMHRRSSFTNFYDHTSSSIPKNVYVKSKSSNDLIENPSMNVKDFDNMNLKSNNESQNDSVFSITTVTSSDSDKNVSTSVNDAQPFKVTANFCKKRHNKPKEPNKWRAITVVMLTSGSFIVSWMPFFITVIFYVFCDDKLTNQRCRHMIFLLGGPLATLAFLNSILNPLIYAWWHKGFKKSLKRYYGIFIASLPAMGWTGNSFTDYRCWYIALFPSALLVILSIVVLSVIIVVCVLYIIILHSAVKNVNRIRRYRETNTKIAYISRTYTDEFKKISEVSKTQITITVSTETAKNSTQVRQNKTINEQYGLDRIRRKISKVSTYYGQARALNSHPTKLKAVKTVMIVILCFVCTWAPYYVTVIIYVKCDIMKHGYDCVPLEMLTIGPLYLLGVSNSLCDPLIYAWRHSGFKRTLMKIYWKYLWSLKYRTW